MKRVFTIIIAATTLLAACSKEQAEIAPDNNAGYGNIKITIVDNVTRADAASNKIWLSEMYDDWTAPEWENDLALEIVSDDPAIGIDGDKPYKYYRSVTTFENTKNLFEAGKYSLKVVSPKVTDREPYDYLDATGKSEVKWYEAFGQGTLLNVDEGAHSKFVYFEGAYKSVEVFPSHTSSVDVPVRIANTAVCVEFTDNFKNYFPEAHLILETAKGSKFNIDYDANTTYEKTYYWVNPREFTIKGSVVRQSPDGKSKGAEETLDDIVKSDVKPQYCYTYRFDMSSAGDGSITITYDDTVIDAGNVKNKDAEDEDWFDVGPSDSEDDDTEDAEDTKKE